MRYHPGIITVVDDLVDRLGLELGIDTIAFNANYTPDHENGSIKEMAALTGAVTVNAPLVNTKGALLGFIWVQDGVGGRVVTYNAIYKTGGLAAFVTTLSTVTIDLFLCNSAATAWRGLFRVTGQAI